MNRIGRIVATASTPLLIAAGLLAGSAAVGATAADAVPMNKLAAKVTYKAVLIGTTELTFNSTSCSVAIAAGTFKCILGGAGPDLLAVSITWSKDTVAYQETAFGEGCTIGSGEEVPANGSTPVAIRIVDKFVDTTTSPNTETEVGHVFVYETGSGSTVSC